MGFRVDFRLGKMDFAEKERMNKENIKNGNEKTCCRSKMSGTDVGLHLECLNPRISKGETTPDLFKKKPARTLQEHQPIEYPNFLFSESSFQ